jgi:hypothetical protein
MDRGVRIRRLTGALLDRLTHHVHIREMNGESYRLKDSKQRRPSKARSWPTRSALGGGGGTWKPAHGSASEALPEEVPMAFGPQKEMKMLSMLR